MRKSTFVVALLVAALGVTGVAYAITVKAGLVIKTTGKKGTKHKPHAIGLNVTTLADGGADNGSFATKQAVIHFDKNLVFNPSAFKTCDINAVVATPGPGAADTCPAGSLVGTGSAIAIVGKGQQITVHPTIAAYNSAGGKLNLKLISKPGEVDSSGVLTGTLKKDTGTKFGEKLVVPIPANLQNNSGLDVTLTNFNTKIKAQTGTGKKPYVGSIGCPSSGKYSFGADFVYTNGAGSQTVKTTSKC